MIATVNTTGIKRRATTLMALALVVALLPSLTYLGHWEQLVPPDAVTVYPPHQQERQSDAHHSDHCHDGASSCAEQPVLASTGLLLDGTEISGPTQPGLAVSALNERAPSSFQPSPLTPPPRGV